VSIAYAENSEFAVAEWYRLHGIASEFEPKMRLAYTRAVKDGKQVDELELRQIITRIFVRVCRTSADVYGLVFNPNSPLYIEAIDNMVRKFSNVVDSPLAREQVRRILPHDLPLHERKKRLNTFGLDAQSAVAVEQERQKRGDSFTARKDVERIRQDRVRMRGNLLAITETNRVVNGALETLWVDNLTGVSKSDGVTFYDRSIRDIANLPRGAVKEIVTRRDGVVCDYCDAVDGTTAQVGKQYNTEYGYFDHPPFHPRCRCFQIISLKRAS
jgi:hypothetical protein